MDFRGNKTVGEKREQIASYLSILSRLGSFGFKLLKYEENEINPQYEEIDGARLALYAEILFISTETTIYD